VVRLDGGDRGTATAHWWLWRSGGAGAVGGVGGACMKEMMMMVVGFWWHSTGRRRESDPEVDTWKWLGWSAHTTLAMMGGEGGLMHDGDKEGSWLCRPEDDQEGRGSACVVVTWR